MFQQHSKKSTDENTFNDDSKDNGDNNNGEKKRKSNMFHNLGMLESGIMSSINAIKEIALPWLPREERFRSQRFSRDNNNHGKNIPRNKKKNLEEKECARVLACFTPKNSTTTIMLMLKDLREQMRALQQYVSRK